MARKKTLTQNQRAFEKQRRRIQQFVNRAKKRGFYFPTTIVPTRPARVTQKAIREVTALKPEQLYSQGYYIRPETGELIPALERRAEERAEAARKAARTRRRERDYENTPIDFAEQVIAMFRKTIEHFPRHAYPILSEWLDRLIFQVGAQEVAIMLQEGARAGLIVDYTVAYDGDRLHNFMSDMLSYMPEMTDRWRAEIMEDLETLEDWHFPS